MAKTKKKTSRAAYWQEHISQWSESGLPQTYSDLKNCTINPGRMK